MTPAEHRDAAVQHLARISINDMGVGASVLTQYAIAHALLGLLEIQITKTQEGALN